MDKYIAYFADINHVNERLGGATLSNCQTTANDKCSFCSVLALLLLIYLSHCSTFYIYLSNDLISVSNNILHSVVSLKIAVSSSNMNHSVVAMHFYNLQCIEINVIINYIYSVPNPDDNLDGNKYFLKRFA